MMFVMLPRLLFLAALAPACSVANPDHCGNLDGDATCKQRAQDLPWCSMCVADNDGCVGELPADSCHAATVASVTTTSATSTGGPTSSTSEGDPPVTTMATPTSESTSSNDSSSGGPGTSSSDASSSTGDPVCGDGEVEGDEVCDGSNTNDQTCVMLLPAKWGGGKLKCTATCESYDDTECCIGVGQTCDPILAPDELCCGGLSCQLGSCKVK
jgi:hypothetical protein